MAGVCSKHRHYEPECSLCNTLLNESAKELVTCPQWRWMAGMQYYCGGMYYRLAWYCTNSRTWYAYDCGGERQYWSEIMGRNTLAYPVLTDDATIGCLMAMLLSHNEVAFRAFLRAWGKEGWSNAIAGQTLALMLLEEWKP